MFYTFFNTIHSFIAAVNRCCVCVKTMDCHETRRYNTSVKVSLQVVMHLHFPHPGPISPALISQSAVVLIQNEEWQQAVLLWILPTPMTRSWQSPLLRKQLTLQLCELHFPVQIYILFDVTWWAGTQYIKDFYSYA